MKRPICIAVTFVYPPIPIRQFDWCAFVDGEEERQLYGYGRTREEAVAALWETLEDEVE